MSGTRTSTSPVPYAATLEGLGRAMRLVGHGPNGIVGGPGLSQLDVDVPPELLDKIKAAMSDAVADGIEAGTRRAAERYKSVQTWAKVQVVATVIAAAAGVGILAYLIWKKR